QLMYNFLLPHICERLRSQGRRVYFTDMHSAVPLADMPDQLHPNQLGYEKMATDWFTAIASLPCTNCPPRFTRQPAGGPMLPGANLTLVASATSLGGPIRYQWRLNDADIPGAITPTFTIVNASLAAQGVYVLVASNAFGATVSSNAYLFLNHPPVLS